MSGSIAWGLVSITTLPSCPSCSGTLLKTKDLLNALLLFGKPIAQIRATQSDGIPTTHILCPISPLPATVACQEPDLQKNREYLL